MHIVIVTGLSGAGKTTALRALEDIEFYCVDNLPLPMLSQFVEHMALDGAVTRVALAVDARQRRYLAAFDEQVTRLRGAGHRLETLFLEANNEVLLRRYSETRRRHPLSGDDVVEGISSDRSALSPLREHAIVVDTSSLNIHKLKEAIQKHFGMADGRLSVTLVSFGFKHGLPIDFNLVVDVRFLPNPYFEPTLSHRDGRDSDVARYVLETDDGATLVSRIDDLLQFSLPRYRAEGRLYVTVAIGCTGGRHRSVAVVEELSRRLREDFDVSVRHRDLERGD